MIATLATVLPIVLAVLAGYALGIWHCKRAAADAVERLRRRND